MAYFSFGKAMLFQDDYGNNLPSGDYCYGPWTSKEEAWKKLTFDDTGATTHAPWIARGQKFAVFTDTGVTEYRFNKVVEASVGYTIDDAEEIVAGVDDYDDLKNKPFIFDDNGNILTEEAQAYTGASSSLALGQGIVSGIQGLAFGVPISTTTQTLSGTFNVATNSITLGSAYDEFTVGVTCTLFNTTTKHWETADINEVTESGGQYTYIFDDNFSLTEDTEVTIHKYDKMQKTLAMGYSFALGIGALTTGNHAFAFGNKVSAASYAFAGGNNSSASSNYAIAYGENVRAYGGGSVALGYETEASYLGFALGSSYVDTSGAFSGDFEVSEYSVSFLTTSTSSAITSYVYYTYIDSNHNFKQAQCTYVGTTTKEGVEYKVLYFNAGSFGITKAMTGCTLYRSTYYIRTTAGDNAFAMGQGVNANSLYAFGFGYNVYASSRATSIGRNTYASGEYSLALGYKAKAAAQGAISIGYSDSDAVDYSQYLTVDRDKCTLAWDENTPSDFIPKVGQTIVDGYGKSHQVVAIDTTNRIAYVTNTFDGYSCNYARKSGQYAVGQYSFASGYSSVAQGNYSVSMGYMNQAIGNYSFAAGYKNTVFGAYSSAIGSNSIIDGTYNFGIGDYANASGSYNLIQGHGSGLTSKLYSGKFVGTTRKFYKEDYSSIFGLSKGTIVYAKPYATLIKGIVTDVDAEYDSTTSSVKYTYTLSTEFSSTSSEEKDYTLWTYSGSGVIGSHNTSFGGKAIGDYNFMTAGYALGSNNFMLGGQAYGKGNIILGSGESYSNYNYIEGDGIARWNNNHIEGDGGWVGSGSGSAGSFDPSTKVWSVNDDGWLIYYNLLYVGGFVSAGYGIGYITAIDRANKKVTFDTTFGYSSAVSSFNPMIESQVVRGRYNHFEGGYNSSSSLLQYSHVEGLYHRDLDDTTGKTDYLKAVHIEGIGNIATQAGAHIEGKYNYADDTIHSAHGCGTSDTDRLNTWAIGVNGKLYLNGVGGYLGQTIDTSTMQDLATVINNKQDKS